MEMAFILGYKLQRNNQQQKYKPLSKEFGFTALSYILHYLFFKSHLAIHMQSLYQRSLNILYAGRHAFSLTLF